MAGDELIYCLNVEKRDQVHNYLLAFFLTLRYFDKQYFDKGSFIRVKGSAWTAGFPIRNRKMTPIKYPRLPEKCVPEPLCKLNLEDYMGPEIDIGFRIGKHTFPGLMVVSLELAYILNDSKLVIPDDKRLRVIDTGWEELKGVWEGNKYPILWLDLPGEYYKKDPANDKDIEYIKYEPYKKWEIEKNEHVANYVKKLEKKKENKCYETMESLDEIIDSLPSSFDFIRPYFIKEDGKLPSEHQKRADFIVKIEEYNKKKEDQTYLSEDKPKDQHSENLSDAFFDFIVDISAEALKKYVKGKKKE